MTLLESFVALVILGLAAVGFIETFQGSSRATANASEWMRAAEYAEAGMERAKAITTRTPAAFDDTVAAGFARHVDVRAWRGELADVEVTVTLPSGARFVVHRLAAAR